jgi:hypothetical protein
LTTVEEEKEMMIISGGYQETFSSSVYSLSYNGSWTNQTLSSLPYAIASHCMVRITDTVLMVIGGYNWGSTSQTFLFDAIKNTWTLGPELNTPRCQRYKTFFFCADVLSE